MAERGTRPDHTKLDWARIDQTEVIEPGSGLKDAGYPDASTPANEEHNSEFFELSNWATYLQLVVPRIFPTLGEALDLIGASSPLIPVAAKERFGVDGLFGGAASLNKVGDIGKSEALGNPILDLACDGQKIYVAIGPSVSGRRNLGSLATQWAESPDSPNVLNALECDALHVYAAYVTSNDVFLLDPVDGATIGSIQAHANLIPDLAANGVHLLVAQEVTNLVHVYDTLGAAPNLVGNTLGHGDDVKAVALDHDQGYVCGTASTLINVRAFDLTSPGAWLWSVALPGVAVAWDIKADGAFVYVVASQGDGNASCWCLRRSDGHKIWRAVITTAGVDLRNCAVDHRYLWISDVNDIGYALDKSSGAEVWRGTSDFRVRCADGHQAFGYISGAGGIYNGRRVAEQRVFTVVPATDPDRRPFPRIAQPEAEPALGAREEHTVFGDQCQLEEETAPASNSTSTPLQYLRLTTPVALPAGTYEVKWFYVWSHGNITSDIAARVQVDDTTDLIDPAGTGIHREEPKDAGTTQRMVESGFAHVALTAGAHDVDIDFWSATTVGTSVMYHARIEISRVA